MAASGDVGIEKDSLVDVFQVDTTGQGVMNTDIPAGSYYIKELATGAGYLLNQEVIPLPLNIWARKSLSFLSM